MSEFVAPTGFDTWNRALRGAYRKGWNAYFDNKDYNDCPYYDLRKKHDNRLTRSFIRAWCDGWKAAKAHKPNHTGSHQ